MKKRQFKTRKARKQTMRRRGSRPYANQQAHVSVPEFRPGIASVVMAVIASAFTRKDRKGR